MKILLLILLPFSLFSQTWTDPVNISPDMPGLDNQPDLCIDKNGTLHCVFTHKLDNNWRKIYYSKSIDDGVTWTTPEDISLNPDTSLMNPHIAADTNNILYVGYDYNTGNPAMTMIHLRTYDGSQWSSPFVVSEGYYNSDHNQLVIDNKNRLYCFWYRDDKSYYRYYENGIWSDVIIPFSDEYHQIIGPMVVDSNNNLKCIGVYLDEGQTVTEYKVIYLEYLKNENTWTEITTISDPTYLGANNWGIDISSLQHPHVVYRQKTSGSGQYEDSTMYTYYNGLNWTEPEVIVNDQYSFEQRIAIDSYDRGHIFDREKQGEGKKLVHYQKYGDFWQGNIIDTADFFIVFYSLIKSMDKLYIAYYRTDVEGEGDIYFSSYNVITGTKENVIKKFLNNIIIYPSPFTTQLTIEYEISKEKEINIFVYNLNGQHIKTIHKGIIQPGRYRHIWNGKDKTGKEVNNGLYLVRLQWGRKSVTKPVEYSK